MLRTFSPRIKRETRFDCAGFARLARGRERASDFIRRFASLRLFFSRAQLSCLRARAHALPPRHTGSPPRAHAVLTSSHRHARAMSNPTWNELRVRVDDWKRIVEKYPEDRKEGLSSAMHFHTQACARMNQSINQSIHR